jgi:ribosomal protein L16 Arg81 hydroxylase
MMYHRVAEDGTVTASIGCFAPCDYHVMGRLSDWTFGVKEPGAKVTMPSEGS